MQAQRKVARQQKEGGEEVTQEVEVVETFEELQEVEEYQKNRLGLRFVWSIDYESFDWCATTTKLIKQITAIQKYTPNKYRNEQC